MQRRFYARIVGHGIAEYRRSLPAISRPKHVLRDPLQAPTLERAVELINNHLFTVCPHEKRVRILYNLPRTIALIKSFTDIHVARISGPDLFREVFKNKKAVYESIRNIPDGSWTWQPINRRTRQ